MSESSPIPRFSVVIPAYNEEAYLPRLMDTVEQARHRYRGGPRAIEDSRALQAPLHVTTPLLESGPLSAALGAQVLLKMEAFQPVGSFKIRGIGRACRALCKAGARPLASPGSSV